MACWCWVPIKHTAMGLLACSIRLTKDTTNWKNKKDSLASEISALQQLQSALSDVNEAGLAAYVASATAARDEAAAALQAAEHAVEAASRELAGNRHCMLSES